MSDRIADVCGRCGALVPVRASRCHRCGRFAPALFGGRRVLDWCFDPSLPHSRAFVGLFVLLYLAAMAVSWLDAARDPGRGMARIDPSGVALYRLGAMVSLEHVNGEWWRLVTCCLLHGSVLHILFNCSSFLVAGPFVESLFGPARFWVVFLATGVAGVLAWMAFTDGGLLIGASGAIFGFIGTMIAWGLRRGGSVGIEVRNYALRWLGYGAVFSLLPGVSMSGHAGGAVAGFVLGWFLKLPTVRGGRESDSARIAGLVAVVIVLASLGCALVFALRFKLEE